MLFSNKKPVVLEQISPVLNNVALTISAAAQAHLFATLARDTVQAVILAIVGIFVDVIAQFILALSKLRLKQGHWFISLLLHLTYLVYIVVFAIPSGIGYCASGFVDQVNIQTQKDMKIAYSEKALKESLAQNKRELDVLTAKLDLEANTGLGVRSQVLLKRLDELKAEKTELLKSLEQSSRPVAKTKTKYGETLKTVSDIINCPAKLVLQIFFCITAGLIFLTLYLTSWNLEERETNNVSRRRVLKLRGTNSNVSRTISKVSKLRETISDVPQTISEVPILRETQNVPRSISEKVSILRETNSVPQCLSEVSNDIVPDIPYIEEVPELRETQNVPRSLSEKVLEVRETNVSQCLSEKSLEVRETKKVPQSFIEVRETTKENLEEANELIVFIQAVIRESGNLNSNQKVSQMTGLSLHKCLEYRYSLLALRIDDKPVVSKKQGASVVNFPKEVILETLGMRAERTL